MGREQLAGGAPAVRFHCPENDEFYQSGVYQHLDESQQHIRLLTALRPDDANPDGPLRFTMSQRLPLAECKMVVGGQHAFIAMSYCAGDPNDTVPILIDGRQFNVFKTLGLALNSLLLSLGRKDGNWELEETLSIWADQVCINQSDGEEKAIQVRMMREIYESCAWAYSWLGLSPEITAGLRDVQKIDHIQQIIENYYEKRKEPATNARDIGSFSMWAAVAVDKLQKMGVDWLNVDQFFKHPYWFRGWVCQEVTVSRDVTFNTDASETDRAGVRRALRLLETIRLCLRWGFDIEHGELVPKDSAVAHMESDLLTELTPKLQGLAWLREMDIGPFLFMLEDSEEWGEIQGYTMDKLMLTARHSEVTDPLDKVYAYLGLAMPGYDITPNYSLSQTTANVYVEATCAYLRFHRDLNILSFAEERTEETGPQIPSWVSDWSIKQQPGSLWFRVRGDDKVAPTASGSTGYKVVLYPHNGLRDRVLGVSAIVVDTINDSLHTVSGPINSYRSWENCLASWLRIAGLRADRGNCPENDRVYPYQKHNTLVTAFWSTLFRGLVKGKAMKKLWNAKRPKRGADGSAGIVEHHLVMGRDMDRTYLARAGWRFVRSRAGYYGLVRADAKDGDVIAVLIGAEMPFLLRPHLDEFKLIGEVYLHGIMHGEIMKKLKGGDGGFSVQDTKLY